MQLQSGRPFGVFRPEQGLLRLGFQRLDSTPAANADSVAQQAANPETRGSTRRSSAPPRQPATLRATTCVDRRRNGWISVSPKRIPLNGRVRAELRWEIFNLLNTVNGALPENDFDSIDFDYRDGRWASRLQLGLRVNF
jgi:hypothetical protein